MKPRELSQMLAETCSVTDKGCWEWLGSTDSAGYAMCGPLRVARATYEAMIGNIPPGMLACHQCDDPLCVNPLHIFLGTHLDNMRDAASKGRMACQRSPEQRSAASVLRQEKIAKAEKVDILLRIPGDHMQRWMEQVELTESKSLTEWIRDVCNGLKPPVPEDRREGLTVVRRGRPKKQENDRCR